MNTRGALLFESGLWRSKANCRNVDPECFFPVGITGEALDKIETAKAVCADCTVSELCLEFALATNQDSGVWGGHSEEERRVMRRKRALEKRRSLAKVNRAKAKQNGQVKHANQVS